MSSINKNFKEIVEKVMPSFEKYGFKAYKGVSGTSLTSEKGVDLIRFVGDKGVVMLSFADERVEMYLGDDSDMPEETPAKVATSLLPINAEARDINYVVSEVNEMLSERFSEKRATAKQRQLSKQTVSKNAVKRGSFYDASTFASRLCLIYPELRDEYKANIDKYGEFLGEEFFEEIGAKKIIDEIKGNNVNTLKKLFQLLNEIYEDGTNDTQSLIAVTILGKLDNDMVLLAKCVDYMSETMAPQVIAVNKYLQTAAGKKAKKQLANPPAYKPKKKKKAGVFAQALAESGGSMPTV